MADKIHMDMDENTEEVDPEDYYIMQNKSFLQQLQDENVNLQQQMMMAIQTQNQQSYGNLSFSDFSLAV